MRRAMEPRLGSCSLWLVGGALFAALSLGGCGAASPEPARPQGCAGTADCAAARPEAAPPPAPVAYRLDELGGASSVDQGVPRPTVCSVLVAAGADPGQAVRVAAERELAPWLRQCAVQASLEQARLSVQFGVGPTGCASEVTIRAEPPDNGFSRCVAAGFYSLRLPVASAGDGTVVRFPLQISAAPH